LGAERFVTFLERIPKGALGVPKNYLFGVTLGVQTHVWMRGFQILRASGTVCFTPLGGLSGALRDNVPKVVNSRVYPVGVSQNAVTFVGELQGLEGSHNSFLGPRKVLNLRPGELGGTSDKDILFTRRGREIFWGISPRESM